MAASTLSRLLTIFEEAQTPLSLNRIAHELQVPPVRLEGMLQFWLRKGRIREVHVENCGTCGIKGSCPFVVQLPRSYELASADCSLKLGTSGASCGCAH